MIALIVIAVVVISVLLAGRLANLTSKVERLEWELLKTSRLAQSLEEELHKPRAVQPETTSANVVSSKDSSKVVAKPGAEVASKPEMPLPIAPPTIFAKVETKPSRTREEWEAFVGGKLLNRIGALALILGVGFFLKYAFDNNWISETVRVGIGAVIGLVCLGAALSTNKRGFQIFAQGLVGAGVSILYLSAYASFNFYHLVPQWGAFVLMSIVTVMAFANALFYDSLAVALMGLAGGFLTPILLSTGYPNEAGLFTYLALLDAGLVAMMMWRSEWFVLEPLTLAGTWLYFMTWYVEYYQSEALGLTVMFVSVFWLLFVGLDLVRSRDATSKATVVNQIVSAFNIVFFYSALYAMVDKDYHDWMGLVTVLLGGLYCGTAMLTHRRTMIGGNLQIRYALTAIVLLVLATSIQFTDFPTVVWWSLEGAVLFWIGTRWKLKFVVRSAAALLAIAAAKFISVEGALLGTITQSFVLFWNPRALSLAVLAASLAASAWLAERSEFKTGGAMPGALHVGWCVAVFLLLTVETNDAFRKLIWQLQPDREEQLSTMLSFSRFMTLAVVWSAYSLPLVWFGLRRNMNQWHVCGLVALGSAVLLAMLRGFAFEPIELLSPIWNVRLGAMTFVAGAMVVQERWLIKAKERIEWLCDVLNILQVGIVLLVLDLFTGETRDYFRQQISILNQTYSNENADAINRLVNLQQLSLSGVWLLYSVGLMVGGLWRKLRGLRLVAIVLFGVTILKIFIYDLSFLETLYRIFSFVGLGLILIGVSYAYQKYKNIIVGTPG